MLNAKGITPTIVGIGKAITLDSASKGLDMAFHYNRSEKAATHGVKALTLQADEPIPLKESW